MKLGRIILLLFILPLVLLPSVVLAQEKRPAQDPVLWSARKAQQEGRISDAEKIANDQIHAIEQTQPNSPELVPYLNLLVKSPRIKQSGDPSAILSRILEIDRAAFGPGDNRSLSALVVFANGLGPEKKEEREQLFKQALDLVLQNSKPAPGVMVGILSGLADVYRSEQRWHEAEPLAERAVKICVAVPMPGFCEGVQSTLAEVYRGEGRTFAADQVGVPYTFANSPTELDALNNAARRDEDNGLYVQAEITYRQAAAWIEAHPSWNDEEMTNELPVEYDGIGRVLEKQGRNALAEEFYKNAIAKASERPMSIHSFDFSGLMNLYRKENRLNDLEPIIQHALELQEKYVGESSTNLTETIRMLGDLYKEEGKYADSGPLYERAVKIEETNLGPDNTQLVSMLSSYADLLVKMHEDAKAAEIQARINEIEKQHPDH